MSETKKPLDTDKFGPTYRPEGSGTHGDRDGMLVEGDDLPESGEGASLEKLGDYLSSVAKVNKYHPSPGSTEAVSHRDVTGAPPVYDSYKNAGAINNSGTDQTFLDEVLGHGAVKEKDFTNIGVSEYKSPSVAKGTVNPFALKDNEPHIYNKGVQGSRGEGHTLLASVSGTPSPQSAPDRVLGKVVPPGPHVIQQRTSEVLQNNRFHPTSGSPYILDGAFSTGSGTGTMGSHQELLGVYNPDAVGFEISKLSEIGRMLMVGGVGHAADASESMASLLPSLQQMGIPYVTIAVTDLAADVVGGYKRTSGGYLLADTNIGGIGWTDNEIDSDDTFGHLNSYFETFSGALPMGMITAALGGLLAILIQAAVIYGIIMLCMLGAEALPERRNPEAPWKMPKGKRQSPRGYNALVGPILTWLGVPELETENDLFKCMLRGIGSLFNVPNLDGIPGLGDLADMFGALMEQGGFIANLMRHATRDLEDVANIAAQIRGNAVSIAAGVIGIIKALGACTSVRFLMTCAKLGDLMYVGDSYTFSPYSSDPDNLVESGASRTAKSRISKRNARSVLRHGALPSRFLLPKSTITAALQYELRSGQGHEALLPLKDKLIYGKGVKNGRIAPETVLEIENKLDCEYVPFYFQDLRTNEILAFHAFLDSISDDYSPEWSAMGGYGRMDQIQIFNKTTRAISISFMVAATNPEDFDEMWWSINKLTSLVYPQWSAGTHMKDSGDKAFIMPFSQVPAASPIIRMRIGDLIKGNYSRFNLARIFGIGHDDAADGFYHQAGNSKAADAEKWNDGDPAEYGKKLKDYYDKLHTAPETDSDSDHGWQDGATAIMRSNKGMSNAPKKLGGLLPVKLDGESQYVEIQSNTVIEIVTKEYPGAPLVSLGPPRVGPPAYVAKFPADSDAAAIYDGEFYVDHSMLMHDFEQVQKDLGATTALPPETPDPIDGTNRGFFDPEKNAIVRAFESTKGRGLAGVITSLSYDYADAPWETRKLGSRAPMWVKVSVSFTPIHDLPPGLDHDGFNRAPLYNVGDIMNNLSGPDVHGSELNFKDDPLVKGWNSERATDDAQIEPKDKEAKAP